MPAKRVIAVDLGAESGRVMNADFDGATLRLEEAHRFPNNPVMAGGTFYWDALRLWHEIEVGIRAAGNEAASIGVDAWGVDFALLDRDGKLLANPMHYRDDSWHGMMDWVFERVPKREVFARTGLQFIPVNGLWRLAYLAKIDSPVLHNAHSYLSIADLFNYWLCGAKSCEFTHASTHQIYNPTLGDWDREFMGKLSIPTEMLTPIVQPGTRIGDYHGIPVILPACHDTGSAVVAVPTATPNYAYLSSGTWSLLGLELDHAILSDEAYQANVTNEGGVYGTWRLLKNISGMWLVARCRAAWANEGQQYDYGTLAEMAQKAKPFLAFIDVDDPRFYAPADDYPTRVREYCRETGQAVPESVGEIIRVIYESLALKYRFVLEQLIAVSGQAVDVLHIIGGGSRNALLCQMSADAIGRPVVAGPTEATALGNAIVQLISLGELSNLAEARAMLARDAAISRYEPAHSAAWNEHYQAYSAFLQGR